MSFMTIDTTAQHINIKNTPEKKNMKYRIHKCCSFAALLPLYFTFYETLILMFFFCRSVAAFAAFAQVEKLKHALNEP